MPYLCTHLAFGARIASDLGASIESLGDAYVLGCFGPDVFFFDRLPPTPLIPHQKKHGNALHAADAAVLFGALKSNAAPELRPYLKGFLTHIALDATLHPYIEARHSGLDHTRFEGVIDSLIYAETADKIPYRDLLNKHVDAEPVDELLAAVSETLYAKDIRGAYRRSLRKFRKLMPFLFDPGGKRYRAIARMERIVRKDGSLSAFLLAAPRTDREDCMNLSRADWSAPWAADRIRSDSVPMLMEEARVYALALIRAFDEDDSTELDRLLNGCTMQKGRFL